MSDSEEKDLRIDVMDDAPWYAGRLQQAIAGHDVADLVLVTHKLRGS